MRIKSIEQFYTTRRQAAMGKQVLVIALAVVILVPVYFMIFPPAEIVHPQQARMKGIYVRENNAKLIPFLEAIKREEGVLLLGTSETNNYGERHNFWGLLNRDSLVEPNFSCFAGAGRSCHVYFPILLQNREAFKGMKVMYFINPTYWRPGLSTFRLDYYDRYTSWALMNQAADAMAERGLYASFAQPYDNHLNWLEQFKEAVNYYGDAYRGHIYRGLGEQWFPESYAPIPPKTESFSDPDSTQIKKWLADIDLKYNVKEKFLASVEGKGFIPLDSATFQYEALHGFFELCAELEIELTVFLGPYNGVFAQERSPELLPVYEATMDSIRGIIRQHNVPMIDGSQLSFEPGTFTDYQHHSLFGAWRIHQLIAPHYAKRP